MLDASCQSEHVVELLLISTDCSKHSCACCGEEKNVQDALSIRVKSRHCQVGLYLERGLCAHDHLTEIAAQTPLLVMRLTDPPEHGENMLWPSSRHKVVRQASH